MNFSQMKLAGALLASVSIACAGPAWSATTAKKHVKSVAKHKAKAKAKPGKAVAALPVAATVATVATVAAVPTAVVAAETAPEPVGYVPKPLGNPYLAYQYTPVTNVPADNSNTVLAGLKSFLPNLPGADGRSILPSIKRVYPTGEKPLVVLTFKCPTEVIGVTPPPIKALHELVNYGFDGINATNLLSFNLQQVCQ